MEDTHPTVERVRELIAAGQYRDEVPGLPGVELEGGGAFRGDRRLYYRGTREYASAAANGLLDRLPPPPRPAGHDEIAEAERLAGAAMPALLTSLYGVANGGFGPGYGLLGLRDGHADDLGRTAVDILRGARDGLWPGMPSGLLPLCHWGCAIYSFVHLPSGRIYGWDPNPVEAGDDVPFFEQEYTIDTWLDAWLDGSLLQPWLFYDVEAGTYRGATIAETRSAMSDEAE